MNATSTLVLILILCFAAERLAKAIMFLLAFIPKWRRTFPDPLSFPDRTDRVSARNRLEMVQTVLIAAVAGAAIWVFEDLHIVRMLVGPETDPWIDMGVTLIVVMGGSDMINRLLQVSGIGEGAAASVQRGPRDNDPIEINGRLVLENPDFPPQPSGS